MEKTILAPGIVLYRTSEEEVKNIFSLVEPTIGDNWKKAMGVNTDTLKNEVVQSRKCYDFPLSDNSIDPDMNKLYNVVDSWIGSRVQDFVNHYAIEKLDKGPYIFLKYNQTDKFDWHVDDGNKFPRTVSVSAYLNDEYEGGEIEFQHYGISHKPKAGDIIVFGSSFSYLHRVKPVSEGTRYAIVNWYRYNGYPMMMGE